MIHWTPSIIIVILLAVVVGVPLLLAPAGDATAPGSAAEKLVIITPHNEQIRFEFARAFNIWRMARDLPVVEFDWRVGGGTSDLRKMVLSELEKKALAGQEDEGLGYDLFFGGGDYEHGVLARGVTIRRGDRDVNIPASLPVDIPPETLHEVYPTADIGGSPLYHPKLQWVGVVLSSFGIVYNRDVLASLGIDEPRTWADLADPDYQGWIALSDPAHSGSIAVTYETILRRAGWMEGWAMLRRAFANARYFTASSSKVPVDVSAGEAAAGMCIDFYGRFQAGAIGGRRVGYVDPPYLTAITADPICILRGAPSQRAALDAGRRYSEGLANQFVLWLLTREAQSLWQRRIEAPGGPQRFELRRVPVRRDMYNPDEMKHWVDHINPFDIARPLPAGTPSYYYLVAPVAHAMAIDVHDELREAWRAISSMPADDPRRSSMLARFEAMPTELSLTWPDAELAANWSAILHDNTHPRRQDVVAALAAFSKGLDLRYGGGRDRDRLLADRLAWTMFFRDQYRSVAKQAGPKIAR